MTHKSGFVNIIGNPNVGKSTIMNTLVGERISIITAKSQTTRHRVLGIVSGDDFQIVYSDTPGVLKPNYKLQESMLSYAQSALEDADILIYVTDLMEKFDKNITFLNRVQQYEGNLLLLINKVDLAKDQKQLEVLVEQWKGLLPKAEIYPISALHNFNIDTMLKRILELLPEGPPYFPKDQLTDRPMKFFASEIIREKILQKYQKEIPYSVEVVIEEFNETNDLISMRAIINVERETQKGIIIGHKGLAIKSVGIDSRKEMESFFGKKVFLEMFVKVNKEWRNKPLSLKSFGYIQ